MDGLVGAFCDRRKEPIYLFLFGRGLRGIVVGHEATDFLESIDMTGDVGAVDMTEIIDEVAEGFLALLRKAFIAVEEVAGSLPAIG